MNETDARVAMIKETRREILRALNVMYHIRPFSFPALCAALTHLELPDVECVKRDLAYLIDKNYVVWTNQGKAYVPWPERRYKLSAAGNEVANAITVDPALEP